MNILQTVQSGENINSVYFLFNNFVIKKYNDKKISSRELDGIQVWSKHLNNSVVKHYFSFLRITFFKRFKSSSFSYDKNKALQELTNLYKKLIEDYKFHYQKESKLHFSWKNYLNNLINYFEENSSQILKTFKKDERTTIKNIIKIIQTTDWSCYQKIPLHRDLHWENILFTNGDLKLIDFEHFCIGPLEYEFCNSIFWNDHLSIDLDSLISLIHQKDINFNPHLNKALTIIYFIDQYAIASFQKDRKKINLLKKTFQKFLQKNSKSLLKFTEKEESIIQNYRDQSLVPILHLNI